MFRNPQAATQTRSKKQLNSDGRRFGGFNLHPASWEEEDAILWFTGQ
jgi:hypothetical protein